METVYIPGSDLEFVTFVKSFGNKAQLAVIDEKFRWVIEREDGTKYIARPESANPV